ncbi:MAG: site-specific integrase [Ktedonobacteraceae bacterium]|nr:site-specific integrase [Ktedonobacteraceae bacterium]
MPKSRKRANGEGSLYQRASDHMWVATLRLDQNKRRVFYGKTQKEALEKRAKAQSDLQQGKLPTKLSKQTVAQFLSAWLESIAYNKRPRTYERYEQIVRLHIVPLLGGIHLQKLTVQHVEAFYGEKLQQGLSPTTVNTIHNVLHLALETAIDWELVTRNVCDRVSPPARAEVEFIPLSLEQIHQLIRAARGSYPLETLITLALTTGMRRGELLGLKWRDVDIQEKRLQIRRTMGRLPRKFRAEGQRALAESVPKSKAGKRGVILVPLAVEALEKQRVYQQQRKKAAGETWRDNDLVFSTSLGTPCNSDRYVTVPFKHLLQQAGLPNIRFHDLRHSAATLLLSLGIHPKIVQEILGHSNINITLTVYSHVLPTMQKDAMEKMHQAFEGLDKERQ